MSYDVPLYVLWCSVVCVKSCDTCCSVPLDVLCHMTMEEHMFWNTEHTQDVSWIQNWIQNCIQNTHRTEYRTVYRIHTEYRTVFKTRVVCDTCLEYTSVFILCDTITPDGLWIHNTHTIRVWNTEHTQDVSWIQNTSCVVTCAKTQLQVSFAKEPYKRGDILQKRPNTHNSYLEYRRQCVIYSSLFLCYIVTQTP